MAYIIYTTKAFIFKERDFGESARLFSFFTEDFGRIDAMAQGIRYLKSKLRYSLSGLSFVRISFVASSNGFWRLTDAEEIFQFENIRRSPEKTRSSYVLFSLIDRMVQGQESDLELWRKLEKIFMFLENKNLDNGDLKSFEILSAMHILKHLGYLEEERATENLSLGKIGKNGQYFTALVQRSIEQSQL